MFVSSLALGVSFSKKLFLDKEAKFLPEVVKLRKYIHAYWQEVASVLRAKGVVPLPPG